MATQSTTAFGVLLKQHRVAAGLTQEALAERAGLSVYGIQKLERGTTHPYRDTALRLASALQLAPEAADRFRAAVEPVRRHGSAPPEHTSADRRHNLPTAMTSFVGREQALIDIAKRLEAVRLVTLTGVGGSGKTRLAIEIARSLVERYRDGAWLVELAQIADPELVPHRLGALLGVHETADGQMTRVLVDTLRNAQVLVVLDNCEHLLDACAALAHGLLRECPALQILATSREPLGIPGEVSWSVPSLAPPDPNRSDSLEEVHRSPAVRLFVDRAAAAQPQFALDANNASAIAQICRRLDGIPLALELAAACLDALTPDVLAARLDRRFRLLTGGNRAALPRQQTLSATIDWSFMLLTETQKRVFERLSVFASGWTLEAAEAVCAGECVASDEVLDALLQLVRKSLVERIDERPGSARYGLLETLRAYASDKLQARGPELTLIRERHAAYYSALVERLDPAERTALLSFSGEALTAPFVETLDAVHDNVRVVLQWWLDAGRATEGLVLVRALGPLWQLRGVPTDGRRWFEAVLDLAARTASPEDTSSQHASSAEAVVPALRAQALMFGGGIARLQGDYARARGFDEASVALWRSLGDAVGLAQALAGLGWTLSAMGDFAPAERAASESLSWARTGGNPFTVCLALNSCAGVARLQGQLEHAAAFLRESLTVASALERPTYRAYALAMSLVRIGQVASGQGDNSQAIAHFRDGLTVMRDSGVAGITLGTCLDGLAAALGRTGQPLVAARLFGTADAHWQASGVRRHSIDEPMHERDVRTVRALLDENAFVDAWNEGRAMSVARAVAYVLDELS